MNEKTFFHKFFNELLSNNLYIYLVFILFSTLVFHPSLLNQQFFWDDERFIFLNPGFLNAPTWMEFWNIRSGFYKTWSFGYTFFWILYNNFSIENLAIYKFINIIFHSLNGLIVFSFLKKCKIHYYLLLTFIFLAHPLNVENVSWIFQLLTIIAFTFFSLSFFSLLNYFEENKKRYLFISIILFSFSLLSKSIAMFAPLLFFAYLFSKKATLKKYLILIPFFSISLILGILNLKGTENLTSRQTGQIGAYFENIKIKYDKPYNKLSSKQLNSQAMFNFIYLKKDVDKSISFNRPEIFSQGVLHYFSKIILPLNQQFIYPVLKIPLIVSVLCCFLISILFFMAYKKTKEKNYLLTLMYVLVFLAPYLGITFITFFYWSNVSDRYTYFLIPAFVYLIGLLIQDRKTYKLLLTSYLFLMIISAVSYGYKFNSPLKLYQEIITYKKHPAIYSLLFEQYLMMGDLQNGESTINAGVLLFPNDELLKDDLNRLEGLKKIYKKN